MLEARFFASLRMKVWRGFSAACQVKVFDLFVVFLDGAQGAVEEPGLPEFALGAPVAASFASKGRSHHRHSRESGNPPPSCDVDPRLRGGDEVIFVSSDGPQAHGNSVEGPRQQGEIRLGEFLSPPEQAHDDNEIAVGKKKDAGVSTPR
jgi:hypothetical protein